MKIKKIALVSAFLDEGDEIILDDSYMEKFVCNDDHFYHRIAKSLTIQGLEPVLFFPSIIKQTKTFQHKYGHSIVRINAKKIPFFHEPIVYSPKLVKKILEFDICHFVSGYYIMYKVPDLFDYCTSKIHNKIPVIARWAGGNYKWLYPIRKSIKRKALQRCHKIICSGKEETQILQKEFRISKNKIRFLMNPIDLDTFQKRKKEDICKKLNYNENVDYLLYIGRLVSGKGIENTLKAFNEILKNKNKVKLIIIGNGPLESEIKKFIEKNSLQKEILLNNHMNHNEICYYYNISSVLINAGGSGGLPNVVIEAIASKLPIVATDAGATKDFVNKKIGTGILIENNQSKNIKLAILEILEKKELSKNFDESILEQFSFKNFGEKMNGIYQEAYEEFSQI
ncbi:MAG: glycosyltransferase family 4 protein [Candidatus Nitrosopumilus sp. bin_7KS]